MIKNREHINASKVSYDTRILAINLRRCCPSNTTKVQIIINGRGKNQIDILLMNEIKTKWIASNVNSIKRKIKLGRKTHVSTADRKSQNNASSSVCNHQNANEL